MNQQTISPSINAWDLKKRGKRRNLFEVDGSLMKLSQGSSLLATLGWRTQSLWD
jgi:hypothetical protein